jgi:hypothetical protein
VFLWNKGSQRLGWYKGHGHFEKEKTVFKVRNFKTYACDPCSLEGRDQEDCVSRPKMNKKLPSQPIKG